MRCSANSSGVSSAPCCCWSSAGAGALSACCCSSTAPAAPTPDPPGSASQRSMEVCVTDMPSLSYKTEKVAACASWLGLVRSTAPSNHSPSPSHHTRTRAPGAGSGIMGDCSAAVAAARRPLRFLMGVRRAAACVSPRATCSCTKARFSVLRSRRSEASSSARESSSSCSESHTLGGRSSWMASTSPGDSPYLACSSARCRSTISLVGLTPELITSPFFRSAVVIAALCARTLSRSTCSPLKAAVDCCPSRRCACPLSCCTVLFGSTRASWMALQRPNPSFMSARLSVAASACVHPGLSVKFHTL
mmetsp:Transcript_20798/g.64488  ORF Transcript_20798/g.64488 Transcript_20798/m.64488 type:complete len:305 (-) Transcript_20798:127-1041(-)